MCVATLGDRLSLVKIRMAGPPGPTPYASASIKLSVVASNIVGVSARAMLTALVDGQRDTTVMADMARSKMRA